MICVPLLYHAWKWSNQNAFEKVCIFLTSFTIHIHLYPNYKCIKSTPYLHQKSATWKLNMVFGAD